MPAVILAMTAVILGTAAWRPGFLLWNDSVAVPAQDLLPWMWGAGTAPPRSVPQDAVVAVLDDVIPGWLLQRLLVAAGLAILGLGVAALLGHQSRIAQLGAAATAMWSAFVFERMAMGHWGLLLAVGAMGWVLRHTADARAGVPGAAARALAWVLVGSLVPTGGALQMLTVAAVLAWPGPRAGRPSLVVAGGSLALQVVWIVPGVLSGTGGDSAGVFGLRAEGVAGSVLTALGTGGIWNTAAMPPSRSGLLSVVAPLLLVGVAAAGARLAGRLAPRILGPLVLLAVLGLSWALASATPALAEMVGWVEALPGGGLLRDAQKWLAPWLVLLSVAAGLGLGRLAGALRGRSSAGPAAVLVLVVPVLLLPDLAFGAWGRMRPAEYPADWQAVRAHLAQDSAPGEVVSWPWSAFRAYPWNAGRTVLDPAPRYLPRTVVTDSRMLVGGSSGLTVVPSDDPRSVAVGDALLGPDPVASLSRLGVLWILVQVGQPGTPGWDPELPAALRSGSSVVVATATLELRRLDGAATIDQSRRPVLMLGWLLWVGSVGAIGVGLAQSALARHRAPVHPSASR